MPGLNDTKVSWDYLRILIVDDSKFFRTLLRTVLRQFGVREVHEAENGEAAFGILATTQVDFVLLDWHMPICTGAEFMAGLVDESGRNMSGEAAIIVITGNTTRRMVQEAAGLGVDGILCKPIVPKLLMKRMAEVLEGKTLKTAPVVDDVVDIKQGLIDVSDLQNKSVFAI